MRRAVCAVYNAAVSPLAAAVSSIATGGLCVPAVTPLSPDGRVAEEDLRRLVRHMAARAPFLFVCGTTGEWNRIDNAARERTIAIGIDEGKRIQAEGGRVKVWAGVTGTTREETLRNATLALERAADALVVAPLAVRGGDPVRLVRDDLGGLFEEAGRALPVYLYDNADLAVDPHVPHIRTRDVKALSRLPWVRGIKVTAGKKVLGNYTKGAAHFRGDFQIFAGNPTVVFDVFAPPVGAWGTARAWWNRYLLHHRLPVGIVAGTANLAPDLWSRAWSACLAGDAARMEAFRKALAALSDLFVFAAPDGKGIRKTIACFKAGLAADGVIASDAVAPQTPPLSPRERDVFLARYAAWKDAVAAL